jgi:hypothetical protein
MHFGTKSYLKNNRNHTDKLVLNILTQSIKNNIILIKKISFKKI